ncbi:protein ripply3-like [Hippopotamus amphibius kiboko]|uniref:protein ripply3-like n=1 Tax=Hippopotamus amphibius kiboko TaxID=575201 RepID=UPI0025929726|nr:protein ripply3-like [Hippopotamus amphibius kiboko]
MKPEATAGAREAWGRVCHCPRDGPWGPPSPRGPESQTPWRPWILTSQDAEATRARIELEPRDDQQTFGSKGAFGFQHSIFRLYLPISKRQEYLHSSGEKVLASFPVQATIHFYNDESDSDEEQEEDTQPSDLQCQEVEDGPGGKGRDRPTNPGRQPRGCSGFGGKGPLPHPDSTMEDTACPSSK